MQADAPSKAPEGVIHYCDRMRVRLGPILESLANHPAFTFQKQILGYYYYVEVWRWRGIDVVFEEADLQQIEVVRRRNAEIIHELVFHPDGTLASTWQPWDGVLLDPVTDP